MSSQPNLIFNSAKSQRAKFDPAKSFAFWDLAPKSFARGRKGKVLAARNLRGRGKVALITNNELSP